MKFVDDIKTNLGKLPQTLEDAYSQIWNEILSESPFAQKITKRALMWVICAREPLDRELWAEASYFPESVPEGGVDILFDLCRNLVAWDAQLKRVIYAHLSVQEYLENRTFNSADANSMAAKSCLTWFRPNQLPLSRNAYTRFALYSISHWPYHIELIEKDMLDILQPFLGTDANPSKAYTTFLVATYDVFRVTRSYYSANPLEWFGHVHSAMPNPLFLMCYFRFGPALREYLKRDSYDIRSRNDLGQTGLCVATMRGNELEMDLLLERMTGVHATAHAYRNAWKEAIKGRQSRALVKILDWGTSIGANSSGFEIMMRAGAKSGNLEVLKAIMERDTNIKINEAVLVAAAGNRQMQVVEYLLTRDPKIKITEAVLTAAAATYGTGEVIEFLFARDPNIKITERVLVAAAINRKVIEFLLARDPNIKITEAVVTAAASAAYWSGDDEVFEFVLDRDRNIEITEAVLVAAAGNKKRVIESLLARDPNIKITEAVLAAAAGAWKGAMIVEFLLARDPNTNITEAVLIAAARNEREVIEFLLVRDPNIKITEAVVTAAAEGGKEVIEFLLARYPNTGITEAVVTAAAKGGKEVIEFLLARDPNTKITEAVVTAAAEGGMEVIEFLLARDPNTKITEAVLTAAAMNDDNSDVIELLLTRDPNITITEAVITAAVEGGKEVIEFLFTINPSINITEAVLMAATEAWDGPAVIELLLARDPNIKIPEAVLIAATWMGEEVFESMLARGPDIKITEAVLTAVATSRLSEEVIWPLLAVDADIEIFEAILARNPSLCDMFMDILLRARQECTGFTDTHPNSRSHIEGSAKRTDHAITPRLWDDRISPS